jgi:hypothetical protein
MIEKITVEKERLDIGKLDISVSNLHALASSILAAAIFFLFMFAYAPLFLYPLHY